MNYNNKQTTNDPITLLQVYCEYAKNYKNDFQKSNPALYEFLDDFRNQHSHAIHSGKLKAFHTVLTPDLENRILRHNINDEAPELLKELKIDEFRKEQTLVALSFVLPLFLMNLIIDQVGMKNTWKKILLSIADENSNNISFDLGIFSKLPMDLAGNVEKKDETTLVKDWNDNFMRSMWQFVVPIIGGEEKIDIESKKIIKKIDAIRFQTKDKTPVTYELSRVVIQQLLINRFLDPNYTIDLEQYIDPSSNKRSDETNPKDPYPHYSKVIQYYKEWTTKRSLVDDIEERSFKERHAAIRSFTRYILRKCKDYYFDVLHDKMKNKEDQRLMAKKDYGIISRYVGSHILDNELFFDEILGLDPIIKNELLKYNGQSFQKIYRQICDECINSIGDKKIIFIEKFLYDPDSRRLQEFLKTSKQGGESDEKPETWEDIWTNLSRSSHTFPSLYNPNENDIRRVKLIYSLKDKPLNPFIIKSKNIIKDLGATQELPHIKTILEYLNKFMNYDMETQKKENKKLNREEKKEWKKDKDNFYTALECALVYIYALDIKTEGHHNTIERLKKYRRLSLLGEGETKPEEREKLYMYLGKGSDKEGGQEYEFYAKNDAIYRSFWELKFEKPCSNKTYTEISLRDSISKVLSSWISNNRFDVLNAQCRRTTKDNKIIYVLNNEFTKEFFNFYTEQG